MKCYLRRSNGLDLLASTEDDRLPQPPMGNSQGHHKRILVVDDNSDVAFGLRLGLENGDKTMQVYTYDKPVTSDEIIMDVVREVHPFSTGCSIKKPIATDILVRHVKAELEYFQNSNSITDDNNRS